MTNSSAAPIMTCAKFLHHGGTHAQVHRTPDTRPSVPLRRRLLPATPGLPIRRQGHLRGPRDGPLRRRGGASPPSPRPAAASGTHPARRPMPTPCTPTSSASRSSSSKVNAAFVDHLPRPLSPPAQAAAPPRRRPDPLALLRPALPGEPRDLPLPGQTGPTRSSPTPPPTWSSRASGSPWP